LPPKVSRWLQTRLQRASRLAHEYLRVLTRIRLPAGGKQRADPDYTLAALSRAALIFELTAAALAPVPRRSTIRLRCAPGSGRCSPAVRPVVARAVNNYRLCLRAARRMGWHNRFSARCARRCAALDPKRCPPSRERFAPGGRPGIGPSPATFRPMK
jgi:hypothetical protein